MRRYRLVMWVLWLALAPIGSVWACLCAFTGQPTLACCAVLSEASHALGACCSPNSQAATSCPTSQNEDATQRACCTQQPCAEKGCAGCSLDRAKPAPAAASDNRRALDWAHWVLDSPVLAGLTRVVPFYGCFGFPVFATIHPLKSLGRPVRHPCVVCAERVAWLTEPRTSTSLNR